MQATYSNRGDSGSERVNLQYQNTISPYLPCGRRGGLVNNTSVESSSPGRRICCDSILSLVFKFYLLCFKLIIIKLP